MFVIEKIRP